MKTIEKPTATTQDDAAKLIKRFLAKIKEVTNEEKRHKKLATDLQVEEDGLLKTSDLTNPQTFESISMLRRKRELIPARLKAYSEELDRLEHELTKANSELEAQHSAALTAAFDALVAKLAQALSPDFTTDVAHASEAQLACEEHEKGTIPATRAALRIAHLCPQGRMLVNQLDWLKNGNYRDRKPTAKAEELLRLVAASAATMT
jgi:folate-binding Fe-S cluster repair protein YgfZ